MIRQKNISTLLIFIAALTPLTVYAADAPAPPKVSKTAAKTGALTADELTYNQAVKDFNASSASGDAVLLTKAAGELRSIAATAKYKDNADVHSLLGYIALKQRETATAVTELQTSIAERPTDLSVRNNLANALQQSNKYDDAATQYQYIVDHQAAIDPVSGKPYQLDLNRIQFNLATVLGQSGRYDESSKVFQTLLAATPDAATYRNYGYFLQKAGKQVEAADAMQAAATLNPKDAQSWLNAGLLYANAGRNEQAGAALAKAVGPDVDPKLDAESEYNAYFALGQIYAGSDPNRAVNEFQTASQLHPQDVAPLYNIAALQDQAGRKTEAEETYRRVLALKPQDGQTLISLGLLLADDGKTKEATTVLAQAVQQTPDNASAHARLADLYARQGDTRDASHERQSALRLNSADDDTRLALADSYLNQKQYGPALVQYDIVARHRPRDTGVLNSRGLAYVQMKNYGAALSAFHQVLAVNPHNAEAENNIGVTYEKEGRKAEALAAYKKAAALNPSLLQARENLSRLTGM